MNKISNILEKIIRIVAVIIFAYLVYIITFYRSRMDWYSETATIVKNGKFVFICVIAVIILMYFGRLFIRKISEKAILITCMIFMAVIGTWLALSVGSVQSGDARICFDAAIAIKNNDHSSLIEGGYLYRFPHQLGIVLYDYLLSFISEKELFYVFVNLFWILLSYLFFSKLLKEIYPDKPDARKWGLIFQFLFLPQILYIFMIYGQVPGVSFLIIALYFFIKYYNTSKIKYLIPGILLFMLSMLIRRNLVIAGIALLIVFILEAVRYKKLRFLVISLIILLTMTLPFRILRLGFESIGGEKLSASSPYSLVIAMGLQEHTEGGRPNGWFNGYNFIVYDLSGYDNEKADEIAKEEIKNRIQIFISDSSYTREFFKEKLVTTWCDPTFESLYTGDKDYYGGKINGSITASLFRGGNVAFALNFILDIWLIVSTLFAFAFVIIKTFFDKESVNPGILFIILFIIGTFMFHIFWETKSQYVYPAICFLSVLSVGGIDSIFQRIRIIRKRKTDYIVNIQ